MNVLKGKRRFKMNMNIQTKGCEYSNGNNSVSIMLACVFILITIIYFFTFLSFWRNEGCAEPLHGHLLRDYIPHAVDVNHIADTCNLLYFTGDMDLSMYHIESIRNIQRIGKRAKGILTQQLSVIIHITCYCRTY